MILHHPFQQLSPETFNWLLRWSRLLFWFVLGLFTYIKYTSMPGKITVDTILATPPAKRGALGFWVGFHYLFMLAYTLFFAVGNVWAAGKFAPGSLFYSIGIVLA